MSVSRREFLEGAAVAAGATALPWPLTPTAEGATRAPLSLQVNGAVHAVAAADHETLADVLRDRLGFTGTKVGCDRGECGACTVLLGGKPVYACSVLAAWAEGQPIRTVESLAAGEHLDPLQAAFVEGDGPQCGFCTPGQLMSARALLDANPSPSREDVRRALAGNLCRCSNYERYVDCVLLAARRG